MIFKILVEQNGESIFSMIRLIEAKNYRCLRYVKQRLENFHVLVGPNGSGKTTFLDTVAFLGALVSSDIEWAIKERTFDPHDLIWHKSDESFQLAIELSIPDERIKLLDKKNFNTVRYEIEVGIDKEFPGAKLLAEKVLLKEVDDTRTTHYNRSLFPSDPSLIPQTLITAKGIKNTKTIVNKVDAGNDNFYDETGKGWDHSFKLGPRKSALSNLPEDESKFPVSTWLKGVLKNGVQKLVLNSALMQKPSPPSPAKGFKPDGSNLPWVIKDFRAKDPNKFKEWIKHLKTALWDLEDIRVIEREEDRHCYLKVCYQNNLEVPSWMVSDGTLRLLALTLPAYLPEFQGIYLIEEPENGIHPKAIETMYQSLSCVYGAQILMATHSPVILSVADVSEILCFSKTPAGATDIVLGKEHPSLRDWKGEPNLSLYFAGGVLG